MLDVWLAALLDSSLKGLALCLAAGAAALLLRRSSAAARHLVWRLAFADCSPCPYSPRCCRRGMPAPGKGGGPDRGGGIGPILAGRASISG